ncbi:Spore coat protein U (SCPU) domain-containing protein [Pseudomonas delhiensis]|uniref:Spore coat protein U (SCPU) domain-containing protein n=1 Tax=Pseudomonas delhiensis TaxID=366289 RepID=A0A239IXP2_9PSED|nr:spore coat U domain-containing protein [Pseudomonas delhiensis]SDK12637.1 Spore coat protein U (SCPU) domain-containing protein [Pseudomonas delhiensis]SNS98329.1 Spore coat protein U (SCPU) domain-containing protein [Pseudomonas delhiensis]
MKHDRLSHALAATLLILPLGQALAAISGQVEVSLEIASGCQVTQGNSASGVVNQFGHLDFGRAGPTWSNALSAQLIGAQGSSLEVTCDPGIGAFDVLVDGGLRGDRTLENESGEQIPYSLYVDAGYTQEYLPDQMYEFAIPSDGAPVEVPIHGAIAPNARALPSGTYRDTLTVTLEF